MCCGGASSSGGRAGGRAEAAGAPQLKAFGGRRPGANPGPAAASARPPPRHRTLPMLTLFLTLPLVTPTSSPKVPP
jgi:hypothetical protein